jgi:hypothetical protein
MPETGDSNIEMAHHLSHHQHEPSQSLASQLVEITEAILLAIVAIATAWSGYQAALWNGEAEELYSQSSDLRIEAEGLMTAANQERFYDAAAVVEWLKANVRGEKKLAALFDRRLLPDSRPAFESWKKSDPLNNPHAPAGPFVMAEFRSSKAEQAAKLNSDAAAAFKQADRSRHRSDDYVRVTVLLATVLLLTAISQRFKSHGVRVGLAVVAFLLLCVPLFRILTLPRA